MLWFCTSAIQMQILPPPNRWCVVMWKHTMLTVFGCNWRIDREIRRCLVAWILMPLNMTMWMLISEACTVGYSPCWLVRRVAVICCCVNALRRKTTYSCSWVLQVQEKRRWHWNGWWRRNWNKGTIYFCWHTRTGLLMRFARCWERLKGKIRITFGWDGNCRVRHSFGHIFLSTPSERWRIVRLWWKE